MAKTRYPTYSPGLAGKKIAQTPTAASAGEKGDGAHTREKSKPLYFASIDGMRFLASAGIVLFHLEGIGGLWDWQGKPGWLFYLIRGPAFHASLFFILGGFIYGSKYLPGISSFKTAPFLKRRFRALYPLHAGSTILMIILKVVASGQALDPLKLTLSAAAHLTGLWPFFPLGTYSLNTPSWALAAFFLCYALLGPMLRLVNRLNSPRALLMGCLATLLPLILWSALYSQLHRPDLYLFFHIFPPIRMFEFLLGMIMARMFLRQNMQPGGAGAAFLGDAAIALVCLCVYCNVRFMNQKYPGLLYFQYHVIMVPLYAAMLFFLARGSGVIAWFFALPQVRAIGACSFYPYLLHIPLFSLTCFIAERFFGYYRLLHSPLNVVIMMALLYAGSVLVWHSSKKRRRYKQQIPAQGRESTKPIQSGS